MVAEPNWAEYAVRRSKYFSPGEAVEAPWSSYELEEGALEAANTSIVMTTYNRRDGVLATLPHLLALREHPPVIVVDDASPDDTAAAVSNRHPEVRVLRAPRNLGSAARNLGVAAARTPYVAFADDDSWWEPGALAHAAELFAAYPRLGLIAGAIEVGTDRRPDPTNALMADSPLGADGLPGPEVVGFVACGAVVRREAFLAVGGFDRRLHIGGEEALLALDLRAAGWRCAYVDRVRARHTPDVSGERPGRRRRVTRNQLWTAWMRRRALSAARITGATLVDGVGDPVVRAAVADAVRGLPSVIKHRSPVPPAVEHDLRRVERA